MLNIWASNKLLECYGAVTATNVSSTNKTDIENLQAKTQNFNVSGNTLSNITTINGIKIDVPHAWNFKYWDYAPFIPVCKAYSGSTTIGHTLIFKDEYGEDYVGAILMCNARGQLEIMGRFSADMYKTDVGFVLRQYKNTSMKFMKYDDTISMLTLNSLDDTATFLGNVIAPNITSIENKLTYIDADECNIYLNSTVRFSRMKIQSGSTVIVDHNEEPIMEIFNSKLVEFFGPIRCNWLDIQLAHMRAITYEEEGDKTIIANTTEIGNLKVIYGIETYTLIVGDSSVFTGSASFQGTVNGYNLDTEFVKLATLSVTQEETIVAGTFRSDNLVGIVYDSNLNTTFFSGNLSSPNISTLSMKLNGITYDEDLKTLIDGNRVGAPAIFRYDDVTPFIPVVGSDGIMEVGNRIDFHRATEEEDFSTCLTNTALNQISIQNTNGTTFGNLELGGLIIRPASNHSCRLIANTASNLLWYNNAGVNTWVCDATGNTERWSVTRDNALAAFTRTTGMTHTPAVVEPDPAPARTTFAHNIYSVECYANRYFTNSTSSLPINSVSNVSTWGAMRIVRTGLAQNTPCGYMFGRGNDPVGTPKNLCAIYYVAPTTDLTKGEIRIGIETDASTSSTNCITFDTDTKETKFPANITAPNLTGISYNNNFLLQSTEYTTATIISNHLHVNLTGITYKSLMGMRAYKGDLTTGQEMMMQVGKSHTAAVSFVYKHNDTQANCEYRIDHPGRVAYRCYYGSTKTEHEIRGNLKVFGSITENASKTITHYTMYEGELQPGCFVETTGQIFREPNSKLSPYEDCITVVCQATTSSNKIIGVCTEILNEEVTDEYGNINQPAGKYCKYATHGDVLIKCVSAVYNVGEILIPTVNGYAKKGQQGEILDAMLNMIPRAKITSVETAEIDSESVCAFISI